MFFAQNICLRVVSAGSMSVKWSTLQELSVMPFLLLPILKEFAGFSLTAFKVTDKSGKNRQRTRNFRTFLPFAVLAAAEKVCVHKNSGKEYDGITAALTEHSVSLFVDEPQALRLGEEVYLTIRFASVSAAVSGTVVGVRKSRSSRVPTVYTVEILHWSERDEYINALYDRIPTMPQSLSRDLGILRYLCRNLARRIGNIR